MRVVVATDAIGTLSSAEAGARVAAAWTDGPGGAEVVVAPVGEAGGGFLQALADHVGAELGFAGAGDGLTLSLLPGEGERDPLVAVGLDPGALEPIASQDSPRGIDYDASSLPLGLALRSAVEQATSASGSPPRWCVVDLGGLHSHDGGAGLLAGLGATADVALTHGVSGLDALTRLDLGPARQVLGGARLIGVVPADETERALLGLRGITSLLGRDPHGTNGWAEDPARLLATDAALEQLARLASPDAAAVPGAGAGGGAAFAVLSLGGTLTTGTQWLADRVGLARSIAVADLVVTGCTSVDFGTRGGGVVGTIARLAEAAMRPCIVIAGEVVIGGRELRAMGVESAYGVRPPLPGERPDDVSAEELGASARRIARSWAW